SPPYVWDTREELDIWVNNPVTRMPNPPTIVGEGRDAFIRMELKAGPRSGILRGPDLTAPARGVQGLRIWYRWRPDPKLPVDLKDLQLRVSFDAINSPVPLVQPAADAKLPPASERTLADFRPRFFPGDPRDVNLDVNYVYFDDFSPVIGVLELDRLELA